MLRTRSVLMGKVLVLTVYYLFADCERGTPALLIIFAKSDKRCCFLAEIVSVVIADKDNKSVRSIFVVDLLIAANVYSMPVVPWFARLF